MADDNPKGPKEVKYEVLMIVKILIYSLGRKTIRKQREIPKRERSICPTLVNWSGAPLIS